MSYLFAAYSITWLILAGYILTLGKRQAKLKKEFHYISELEKQN